MGFFYTKSINNPIFFWSIWFLPLQVSSCLRESVYKKLYNFVRPYTYSFLSQSMCFSSSNASHQTVLRTVGGLRGNKEQSRSKRGPRFIWYDLNQTKLSAFNFSISCIIEYVWTEKALFLWIRKNVSWWRVFRNLIKLEFFSWIEL